jgi:hypothetical protein
VRAIPYFLVIALFAMKLSEVVADFGRRADLVSLQNYVPHLGLDC